MNADIGSVTSGTSQLLCASRQLMAFSNSSVGQECTQYPLTYKESKARKVQCFPKPPQPISGRAGVRTWVADSGSCGNLTTGCQGWSPDLKSPLCSHTFPSLSVGRQHTLVVAEVATGRKGGLLPHFTDGERAGEETQLVSCRPRNQPKAFPELACFHTGMQSPERVRMVLEGHTAS